MNRRERRFVARKKKLDPSTLKNDSYARYQKDRLKTCPFHSEKIEFIKIKFEDDDGIMHLGRECPKCHNRIMVENQLGSKVPGYTVK